MFKITPIQDKSRQKEICEAVGATFRENFFAYIMYDCDTLELMGMSQFEISDNGYISDIRETPGLSDYEAMFILARQTMNFIDSCGAHVCYADRDSADSRLLHAVGFRDDGERLVCDMTDMFSGKCANH